MKLQNVGSSLFSNIHSSSESQPLHQRNCWDPRTWTDSFEPAKAPKASAHPIVAPTGAEPIGMYMSIAAQAMDNGRAVRVTDSAQLGLLRQADQSEQGHDITPPHTSDNAQTMYLLEGRIFVRVIGFAGPAHAQWYEVAAPRF